jgi:hypothetical protein
VRRRVPGCSASETAAPPRCQLNARAGIRRESVPSSCHSACSDRRDGHCWPVTRREGGGARLVSCRRRRPTALWRQQRIAAFVNAIPDPVGTSATVPQVTSFQGSF